MATTPEAKIKLAVSTLLRNYRPEVYFFMPVQTGYGARTLDYLGCVRGKFFAIEAKAPGKKLTDRQDSVAVAMLGAGAEVFLIDGPEKLAVFEDWLTMVLYQK